jgi:hypothetical protein
MDGGIFKKLTAGFGRICGRLPDKRRPGHNSSYGVAGIVKRASGVFFFQYRSMPGYQRRMREKYRRSNPGTVFEVTTLPSDTWIRTRMDLIPPEQFGGVFNSA